MPMPAISQLPPLPLMIFIRFLQLLLSSIAAIAAALIFAMAAFARCLRRHDQMPDAMPPPAFSPRQPLPRHLMMPHIAAVFFRLR
jgi:hypothetical protein